MSSDDAELREDVKAIIRKHDPSPEEVQTLVDSLTEYKQKIEALDDAL